MSTYISDLVSLAGNLKRCILEISQWFNDCLALRKTVTK